MSPVAVPLGSPRIGLAVTMPDSLFCQVSNHASSIVLRTHTCGELRAANVGQEVTICGWVDSYRDHGGGLFVDLRDRYGLTQVVFNPPDTPQPIIDESKTLRAEYAIQVTGIVTERPTGMANSKLATGAVELRVTGFKLLNKSLTPPVSPNANAQDMPNEELRLEHRYLDLRRPVMQQTLLLRDRIIKSMRDYFAAQNFIDVETPILGRSTPEGARDYLVPSRVSRGSFYALPQSPQLYKQILMMAGYDRYVQVARCFRDEDLRADRQPEFTQLDLEMSFVDADDVIGTIDGLVQKLAKQELKLDVKLPLPRMTYDEAMERFGHDAPDLRFDMEIVDCTDIAAACDFRVFKGAAEAGERVRGLNARGAAEKYSRKNIDDITEWVKHDFGCKGMAWFKVEAAGTLASPIAKHFKPEELEAIKQKFDAKPGDFLVFIADKFD